MGKFKANYQLYLILKAYNASYLRIRYHLKAWNNLSLFLNILQIGNLPDNIMPGVFGFFINALTTKNTIFLSVNNPSMFLENFLTYWLNSMTKRGYTNYNRIIIYSLLAYIKEYSFKNPLIFIINCILADKQPPFLIQKYQKSNRTNYFPVPFRDLKKKKKLFFFFFSKPLRKLTLEYRRLFSRKNQLFFSILMHLYFPETSAYTKFFNEFIAVGVSNRMYLHYRWRFKKIKNETGF